MAEWYPHPERENMVWKKNEQGHLLAELGDPVVLKIGCIEGAGGRWKWAIATGSSSVVFRGESEGVVKAKLDSTSAASKILCATMDCLDVLMSEEHC